MRRGKKKLLEIKPAAAMVVVAEEASDGIQKAVFASRGDTEVRQKKKARQIKEGADIMYAQQNEKEGTKKLVYAKKNLKKLALAFKTLQLSKWFSPTNLS